MSANDDDHATRQTVLPASSSPDDQATGHVADVGIVAELRAVLTNGERKVLPLYKLADQLVIGRGTACEWQLDDASLSRKHAQLKWNGHELTVEDMGSANGTRVNGKPARTPLPAKPGEVIQLGTVMCTLELRGGPNPDEQSTRLVQTPRVAPRGFSRAAGVGDRHSSARASPVPRPRRNRCSALREIRRAPTSPRVRGIRAPPWYTPPTRPSTARCGSASSPSGAPTAGRLCWRARRCGSALLLGIWYLHDSMMPEEESTPSLPRVSAPKVTSLAPPEVPVGVPLDGGVADTSDRDRAACRRHRRLRSGPSCRGAWIVQAPASR